jgi:hypothetical protein
MKTFLLGLLGLFLILTVTIWFVCRDRVTKWDPWTTDFESYICTKNYAVEHGIVLDSKDLNQSVFLVCRMRNYTSQHIYARLKYSQYGVKEEIEIASINPNREIWVTAYKPLPVRLESKIGVSGRENVVLKTKELEVK